MTILNAPRDERDREVRVRFVRLLVYTLATGVLMVIGALVWLSMNDLLTPVFVVATTLGVFLSVLVGSGLMALGFLSSNSGHDEWAGRSTKRDGES